MHLQHKQTEAMIKAMLNSPVADSGGRNTLFSHADYSSLGPMGKNRAALSDANNWMVQASQFLDAYSTLDTSKKRPLLDSLQVRMVMTVHAKKNRNSCSLWRAR